jgi:hypothetical protein
MRKVLFSVLVGVAVLALAPAAALARGDHHRHHRKHARHARIRHDRFGSDQSQPTAPGAAQDAGTVQSFNNQGVLTILLNDGSTVTGRVTNATELKCEAGPADEMNREHGRRGAEGDRSGNGDRNGNGDQGDDQGRDDQGDDQGEDQGEGAAMCSTANLTPGAVVREAELTVSTAGAIWNQVELDSQHA